MKKGNRKSGHILISLMAGVLGVIVLLGAFSMYEKIALARARGMAKSQFTVGLNAQLESLINQQAANLVDNISPGNPSYSDPTKGISWDIQDVGARLKKIQVYRTLASERGNGTVVGYRYDDF